jgi:putative DNA methylase
MAVFSRYSEVIEADGSPMTVRTALTLINQALDEVLSEDDGELDGDTRFCLKWYGQVGWSRQKFGLADDLARATNTSVEGIARGGVLTSKDGWVTLTRPTDLPDSWNPEKDDRISIWEVTAHPAQALTRGGVDAAARLLAATERRGGVDQSAIQGLAYRVYELAHNKDPETAGLFNLLGSEWSTLERAAADLSTRGHQDDLGLDLLV